MDSPAITFDRTLARLTAEIDPAAVAASGEIHYADFRARNFKSLTDLLGALFVWVSGDFSLRTTAALVTASGIKVTKSSLEERFARSAEWLQLLLSMVLCGNAIYPKEDCVRVLVGDSTSLSGPGAKGTDYRVHALFDLATGALVGAHVTDAHVGESAAHHLLGRESFVLYDRGYSSANNIHTHAKRGAKFLLRCNPHSIRLCDAQDAVLKPSLLEAGVSDAAPLDMPVRIPLKTKGSSGAHWHRDPGVAFVEARLIGIRTRKGVMWLLTDMPAEALPSKAAGELYRRRWQIELLFKALKSIGDLDGIKCRKGPLGTAWICGKLLLAALAQKIVPSYEPPTANAGSTPYRASAWVRFQIGHATVRQMALAPVLHRIITSVAGLERLRNAPRRRLQHAPVTPFNPSIHQDEFVLLHQNLYI